MGGSCLSKTRPLRGTALEEARDMTVLQLAAPENVSGQAEPTTMGKTRCALNPSQNPSDAKEPVSDLQGWQVSLSGVEVKQQQLPMQEALGFVGQVPFQQPQPMFDVPRQPAPTPVQPEATTSERSSSEAPSSGSTPSSPTTCPLPPDASPSSTSPLPTSSFTLPPAFPSQSSVPYQASHNSMVGNPSLGHIVPQSTNSQLFPSNQPPAGHQQQHSTIPAAQTIRPAFQRPQVMKQYQPPPFPGTPGQLFQQRAGGFVVGFPTFPPTMPLMRNNRPVVPSMMPFAAPPTPPPAVPLSSPQGGIKTKTSGLHPSVGPLGPRESPTPTKSRGSGPNHHHDNTQEQIEGIIRELNELKTLVDDKEAIDLYGKMEVLLNSVKRLKIAFASTIRELKKDERFREEKSRADSKIRAVYIKAKADYWELASTIDLLSSNARQMLTAIKKKGTTSPKSGSRLLKHADLLKLNEQMDRLTNDISLLMNACIRDKTEAGPEENPKTDGQEGGEDGEGGKTNAG